MLSRCGLFACLLLLLNSFAVAATPPPPPSIDAKSWLLMDFDSGEVLASFNPELRAEPASITKVMTTYIVFDEIEKGRIKPDDRVPISEKAWRQGIDSTQSRMFVEVGDQVPVIDLLRGVIIASGNDASVALAEYVAGSEEAFADLMNQHAQRLGMRNTHFVNASGMPDPAHYTTAHDLGLLARATIADHPDGYAIYKELEFKYGVEKPQLNRNYLLKKDPTVDGIKTGHTSSAGYCLMASAKRGERRLISVVLGTASWNYREQASMELLNYGFRFWETVRLFGPAAPVADVQVWKATAASVPVSTAQTLAVTLPRGDSERLSISPALNQPLVAPLSQGAEVGSVSVALDGKILATAPLVLMQDVEPAGLFKRLADQVRLWFN